MTAFDVFLGLDEFEKEGFFITTFVHIDRAAVSGFIENWQQLQQLVRTVLLEEYPEGAHTPALLNGALPEIHAEPMFRSKDIFRKYPQGQEPPTDKEYYLKHYHWLELALRITKNWGIKFHSGFVFWNEMEYNKMSADEKQQQGQNVTMIFRVFADAYPPGKFIYNARRLEELLHDVYFSHITSILTVIEDYLSRAELKGKLFCDVRGKYEHWFAHTDVFDALRSTGYFKHLANPSFWPSEDNELLQASDVIGYVAGQHYFAESRGLENTNAILARWWDEYVKDAKHPSIPDLQETQRPAISLAITLEVAGDVCIPDLQTRAEFKAFVRFIVGHQLAGLDIEETLQALKDMPDESMED